MKNNPLLELQKQGQSIWYDNIQRGLLVSGKLKKMIDDGEVQGVTSNPSIFEKAINGSNDYDQAIKEILDNNPNINIKSLYEALVIPDIQNTADLLRNVYENTNCKDGYVSIEVSPLLAHDTEKTISEARTLFKKVNRPNVMIKVPATKEGLPAITTLIGEGININVTLMFSRQDYIDVAEAYISGLEKFALSDGDLSKVASVASFFVSRIDTAIDKLITDASAMRGKIAIANSKIAYGKFLEIFSRNRFKALEEKGAKKQRLLWASTGTKNPAYSDVLYVEELIGPDTVNTLPPATLQAFKDHGKVAPRITENLNEAIRQISDLINRGINLDLITTEIKTAGIELFSKSFEKLLEALKAKKATYNK
jgi:transaldolase / glucose-6-phosphate isomerase